MSRAWFLPILIAAAAATFVAIMGATITDIGPWYRSLIQPHWAPPEAVYGTAWTIIYAFTAVAAVTSWRALPHNGETEWLIGMFALNGFLNLVWSFLFFHLHRPDWALIEVIGLWLSILALVVFVFRRSMLGAVLLLPYLGWVTFAGYLNMTIVRLNGPFG